MKTKKKRARRDLPNYSLGVRLILDTKTMTLRKEQMTPAEIKAHNKAIN